MRQDRKSVCIPYAAITAVNGYCTNQIMKLCWSHLFAVR